MSNHARNMGLLSVLLFCVRLGHGAEGRVFFDVNGNGVPDAAEPGVAGVAVSDGVQVVDSDAQGRFRLDTADPDACVWMSVPRDHAASGPFWRRAGSGVPLDFGLAARPQAETFTFVQITDTHVGRADLVSAFAKQLARLPHPFAFAINTGDLVGGVDVVPPEKAQTQYDRYLAAAAAFELPLFHLPGNHEHVAFNTANPDTSHPFYGKGLYRRVFGPPYYSWAWAGVHCVALDGTSLPYQERLGTNQLAWLAADLKRQPADRPILLFCHQSLPALRDAKQLMALLQGRRVLGAFCGHLHQTFTTRLGEIPVHHSGAMSGAWWSGPNIDGTPQGFRVVQVQGDSLKTAYFSREGDTPIAIISPLATDVQHGEVAFEAVVLDFGRAVELNTMFDGQSVAMAQAGRDELWSRWRGTLDTRPAFDGDRTLAFTARQGEAVSRFSIRYLVENGRPQTYQATAPATLALQVRGVDGACPVLFNGEPLGMIPSGTTNECVLTFPVDPTRLAKMNRVTIQAGKQGAGGDHFSAGPVWLAYAGKKLYDLRYASFERHTIAGSDPKRVEKVLYYCLP